MKTAYVVDCGHRTTGLIQEMIKQIQSLEASWFVSGRGRLDIVFVQAYLYTAFFALYLSIQYKLHI